MARNRESDFRRGRARRLLAALAVDRTPFRVSADYRRLWWAELVSQTGHQITVVAVFYQVYELTESPAKVGLVGLVQLVPLMVAAILGGPLIDRLDRRKLLLATQAAHALISAVLLSTALMDHPPLWMIYVAAGVSAGVSGIASPTRGSIVPNLIPRELLPAAISLNQVMWNAAQIAGPAVGGVLIAEAGVAAAYAVDLVTYSATILVALRLPPQVPVRSDGERVETGLAAVRASFAYLRGRRTLQATFVIDLIAMIFGMPRALFPIIAVSQFNRGPEVVGALFSAIAVGAVIGAVTSGWVGRIRRQGLAVLIAVAVWGLGIAAFGLTRSLPLAFVLLAIAGMADVISAVFRGTILQANVTDSVRGRLSAIHLLVVSGGPRLGDFEAGLVASLFTPAVSIVSGGVICVAGVFVVGALMPQFRRYRVEEADPTTA